MIRTFEDAVNLCTHLAEQRGIATASNRNSTRYWGPLPATENGRAELVRRIRAVIDGDPSGLHGNDQGEALKNYSAMLGAPIEYPESLRTGRQKTDGAA
jgi:hypothetical protein